MPRHHNFHCSSDSSSSDNCVPGSNTCGFKCAQQFIPEVGEVFVLSANQCDASQCPDYSCEEDDLCDETTLSKCPEIIHCVEVKKPKKKCGKKKGGRCGDCGYTKCKCDEKICDWSVILCDEADISSDSCCDESCDVPITPCFPCNAGAYEQFPNAPSDDSCMPKKCKPKCDSSSSSDSDDKKKKKWKHGDECGKCCYPKDKCRCKKDACESKGKARTIKVAFVNKKDHPQRHRIITTDKAIAVNGVTGGAIHLTRGNKYHFEVAASAEFNFYFTADMMGGPAGQLADPVDFKPVKIPGSADPAQGKTVVLHVDSSVPKRFYYQSTSDRCMGGDVFVHSARRK